MFSVALSVESFPPLRKKRARMGYPLPDVIRHTALRSSDFPLLRPKMQERPSGPAAYRIIIEDIL